MKRFAIISDGFGQHQELHTDSYTLACTTARALSNMMSGIHWKVFEGARLVAEYLNGNPIPVQA